MDLVWYSKWEMLGNGRESLAKTSAEGRLCPVAQTRLISTTCGFVRRHLYNGEGLMHGVGLGLRLGDLGFPFWIFVFSFFDSTLQRIFVISLIWVCELGFLNLLYRLRDLGVRVLILLMSVKLSGITAFDEIKILLMSLHDLLTCPFCLPVAKSVTKWALYDPSESRFASIHLSSNNTNTIFCL
ncbi:hypothetical protein V8G54_008170 [Vigna mungo]|uniref:Uncharacterized protein n=1 Tax=Vigna mungo TaxID=3915 RepID=A0AAQ3P3R3_VIGMU